MPPLPANLRRFRRSKALLWAHADVAVMSRCCVSGGRVVGVAPKSALEHRKLARGRGQSSDEYADLRPGAVAENATTPCTTTMTLQLNESNPHLIPKVKTMCARERAEDLVA